MCEFCKKFGDGEIWYLNPYNYSTELLHEELSSHQKNEVKAINRREWIDKFFKYFMVPMITNYNKSLQYGLLYDESQKDQLTNEQISEHKKVEHFGQIIPLEDAIKVIDIVDSITLWPCGCRYLMNTRNKYCCFGLNIEIERIQKDFPESELSFKKLTKSEAKDLITKLDKDRVYHTVWTSVSPYITGLCTCGPHCIDYNEYFIKKGHQSFFRAEYIFEVITNQCNGCGNCIDRCLFNAISYSHTDLQVIIDPIKCYGCGCCRNECAFNAINLIKKKDNSLKNRW